LGSETPYLIEAQIAQIQIDPRDGRIQAVIQPTMLHRARGSLSVEGELLEEASLSGAIGRLAGEVGSICPYALPSPTDVTQYVPMTALLAVRAFASTGGSPTAEVLSSLGVPSAAVVYDVRAVALRGEIL